VFAAGLLGAAVAIGSHLFLFFTDDRFLEFLLWVYPGFFFTALVPHTLLGNTPLVLAFVIGAMVVNGFLYAGLAAIITSIVARLCGGLSPDQPSEAKPIDEPDAGKAR
jgi:hypothetical protein